MSGDSQNTESRLLQSPEQYSLALEAAGAGAWEWDIATNRTLWSAQNYRLLGLDPGSGASDYARWLACVHPEDRERAQLAVTAALEQRSDLDFEYRCVWPDGTIHWIRDIGRLVFADDGRPKGMYGIQIETTAQHAAEESLRRAQRMEAVGRVAGAVAHDFNNLLTVVRGYCGLLVDVVGDRDDAQQMLTAIESAGTRASELTRQLLALGRRQILQPEQVDLDERITGLLSLLRTTAGEDVELVFRPSDPSPTVHVDPRHFDEMLLATLLNARDRLDGEGRIVISTSTLDPPGSDADGATDRALAYGVITIEDSGPTLTEEQILVLFDPLGNLEPGREESPFGLAAVNGIVEQSGGNVVMRPGRGGGSILSLQLPVSGEGPSQSCAPSTSPAPAPAEATRVLFVEDERSIRDLFVAVLEQHDYPAFGAGSAEEALTILRQEWEDIGLVVSDVVLPGATGPQLAESLLEIDPSIKVILMSGYGHEALGRMSPQARAFPLLRKPFSIAELLAVVESSIGRPSQTGSAQKP